MASWNPGPAATNGNDLFTGDGGDNTANGLEGDDTLLGGGGDDTLTWTIGNDWLNGESGNDVIVLTQGSEGVDLHIDGGADADTLVIEWANIGPNAALSISGIETIVLLGSFTLDIAQLPTSAALLSDASITFSTPGTVDVSAYTVPQTFSFDGVDHESRLWLRGSSGDDTYIGFAGGGGLFEADGEDGNDSLVGGAEPDLLRGGRGNDTVYGGGGNDTLTGHDPFGNSSNDTDYLYGDEGDDVFRMRYSYDAATWHMDGGEGDDTLEISSGILRKGSTVTSVEKLVLTNSARLDPALLDGIHSLDLNGEIEFLAPGNLDLRGRQLSGSGLRVLASDRSDTITMPADAVMGLYARGEDGNDSISGGAGQDYLSGGLGDDTLLGGGGDDQLFWGEGGSDVMDGGGGNDTITLSSGYTGAPTDGVLAIDGGPGNDVLALNGGRLLPGSTLTGFERYLLHGTVTIEPGLLPLSGKFLADGGTLVLATPGTLDLSGMIMPKEFSFDFYTTYVARMGFKGSAGNDHLIMPLAGQAKVSADGLAGDDTLDGGAVADTLNGSAGRDVLTGNDGDDWLRGGDDADTLIGGAGGDILDGGAGADVMIGGEGDDGYAVTDKHDQIVETGDGHDGVTAQINYTLPGRVEDLYLQGFAHWGRGNSLDNLIVGAGRDDILEGRKGDDLLFGGDGDDELRGQAGDDSMVGGNGDDRYYVDSIGDQIAETTAGPLGGSDRVYSQIDYTLGGNLEFLFLTGAQGTSGTGNELDNRIFGNAGTNLLLGLAGADRLDGGDATDTLAGGEGNDTLAGGRQADVFRFDASNAGADLIEDFNRNVDRFDLSGGSFTSLAIVGGDTILRHDGGSIRIVGTSTLTLDQWNDLVLPAGDAAPASFDAGIDAGAISRAGLPYADYTFG